MTSPFRFSWRVFRGAIQIPAVVSFWLELLPVLRDGGQERRGVEPLRPRFGVIQWAYVMELIEGDEELLFLGKLEEGY